MTKSSGTGRGQVNGSKNVPKKDTSQRRMDVFLQLKSAEQGSSTNYNPDETLTVGESSTSAATSSSSCSEEISSTELNCNAELPLSSNQSSEQNVNGNFEPLDCDENEDCEDDKDNDVLPVDYASIEREEEEFLKNTEYA